MKIRGREGVEEDEEEGEGEEKGGDDVEGSETGDGGEGLEGVEDEEDEVGGGEGEGEGGDCVEAAAAGGVWGGRVADYYRSNHFVVRVVGSKKHPPKPRCWSKEGGRLIYFTRQETPVYVNRGFGRVKFSPRSTCRRVRLKYSFFETQDSRLNEGGGAVAASNVRGDYAVFRLKLSGIIDVSVCGVDFMCLSLSVSSRFTGVMKVADTRLCPRRAGGSGLLIFAPWLCFLL